MKKKKQWYTNRVYERSRNVSHSFTLNEIICYTCRTIKRFVNVFYFYMYIYATNSKCQSLTVPCHTARCYAMKIGIWIHFKRKNDSQKKKIFALPYGRYVFMMRKSGDYFTIFIFVFVMVMYNTLCQFYIQCYYSLAQILLRIAFVCIFLSIYNAIQHAHTQFSFKILS